MAGRLIARSVAGRAFALVLLALVFQILGEFACGTVQRRGPAALVQAAAPAGRRLGIGYSGGGGLQRALRPL